MISYFAGVDELLEALDNVESGRLYGDEKLDEDSFEIIEGRNARWAKTSNYIVEVPIDKIEFTQENNWFLPRAKAYQSLIENGALLEPPAGRLFRIKAADVKQSKKWEKTGELRYQTNMLVPWNKADTGTFYVQLLDGNHRALAAIAAGEVSIPMIVGQNYRDDVKKKEWL